MKPVYKIETLTVAVLDHTITDEATFYTKNILTDGVGHFIFTVPAEKGGSYVYDDIAVDDIVKFYHGYDSVPASPNFSGKVAHISGLVPTGTGWVRQISGLSFGEILLRRLKKNKIYEGTTANAIVSEWAGDLGILHAADIDADATPVYLTVQTKSYFDLLKWISDYWKDAGTQVKKDFFVGTDNHLHWKARPIRTAGVETLTVGDNIIDYSVDELVDKVKNDVVVYGANEKCYPADKDLYTEQDAAETVADDGWTVAGGASTVAWDAVIDCVGNESVHGNSNANINITLTNSLPDVASLDCTSWKVPSYKALHFWIRIKPGAGTVDNAILNVAVECPNAANSWGAYLIGLGKTRVSDVEKWFEIDLPFVWNADVFTDPVWDIKVGAPDWSNVQAVHFYATDDVAGDCEVWVDGLHFRSHPFSGTASDAASKAAYQQRDLEVTDPKLLSDSDCAKRAETLLYQLKDLPSQITVTLLGNNNVLIGDRIAMTIPAEGISGVNYDVISVEHSFSSQGYKTKATLVNSANVRCEMEITPTRTLAKMYEAVKNLNVSELTVK